MPRQTHRREAQLAKNRSITQEQREHSPVPRALLGFGAFLVGNLLPNLLAPELQWAGVIVGTVCLVLGTWPYLVRWHRWLNAKLDSPLPWLAWLGVVIILIGLINTGWKTIKPLRYHLNYEMCFGAATITTRRGPPKVIGMKVWPRIMNRNSFPVDIEIEENGARLATYASTAHFTGEKAKIIPGALDAIRDFIPFNPPIDPQVQDGNVRYVINYGIGKDLSRTMIINGQIDTTVTPDGRGWGGQFTPNPDSDDNYVQKDCFVTEKNAILYHGN